MYKIVVKQTYIIINDYTFGDYPKIENCFRTWDGVTHSLHYKCIEYDDTNKTLTLPRGMDISLLEKVIGVKAYYENKNSPFRYNNDKTLVRYKPKNEKQIETLSFLLGKGQYRYTKNYSQLAVNLNTGAGKTYLGIAYMSALNIKSVIITCSVDWLNQWKTRITEHTNILPRDICFIDGSDHARILMSKSPEEIDRNKIYLITHGTIASLASNNGWDYISQLFTHLGIGIKIFDEAHLHFDNITAIDFHTNVYRTLYLTATPAKSDERENEIFQTYFKNVPNIVLFDPNSDPRTRYIAIRYKSGLDAKEISKCNTLYGFNRLIYCDQVIYKRNFDLICRVIMDIISRMRGKKLIFLSTNNAVMYMYEWIICNYPEYDNMVGIYTSINDDKESAKSKNIILTTSQSAGAALDISDVVCSVQLAEPYKSETQNRQRLGRTRGANTFYIDLIDDSCSTTSKYYINNLPLFEKYALSTKEMRFTNVELEDTAFRIMEERSKNGINPFIRL